MMRKKTWVGLGLFALATLGLTSTALAVSPHSSWYASRHNSGGTTYTNMSPSGTTFCFLTGVEITETDTGAETARCTLKRGAYVWTLEATLGTSSDADVECEARCYYN